MGFDKKLLNENEDVLLNLRPHWWYVTPSAALLVAAVIGAAVVYALDIHVVLTYFFLALVLVALVNFAWRMWNWRGVNFVVSTDRLIYRTGVLTKRGIEIPLERVNTVFFSASLFERLVGSGDLTIESAGEGGQQSFDNVRRPQFVQQEIYRAMAINKSREFAAMAEAHSAVTGAKDQRELSIPEQIEQLDQLRLRGVITEAEFQTKKADLLNRM